MIQERRKLFNEKKDKWKEEAPSGFVAQAMRILVYLQNTVTDVNSFNSLFCIQK